MIPNFSPISSAYIISFSRSWQVVGEKHPRLLRSASNQAQLYHCHLRSIGHKWKVEEIKHFDQEDLDDYDIMMMDIQDEVFVWVGKHASENERILAPQLAEVRIEWKRDIVTHFPNKRRSLLNC